MGAYKLAVLGLAIWACAAQQAGTRGFKVPRIDPANPGGKTYALVIGISDYPASGGWTKLHFATADAKAFAEDFLQKERGGTIPREQIRVLLDQAATRAGIDSAVKQLAEQAKRETQQETGQPAIKQNILILFVASHGREQTTQIRAGKQVYRDPYIVTYDADENDLKTTGYPMNDFRAMIAEQTQNFARVIAYIDACESVQVRDAAGEKLLDRDVKAIFDDNRIQVGLLMAAQKSAYEAPEFDNHGAFTYAVLSGLNGAAQHDNPHVITLGELFDYVRPEVRRLTKGATLGTQIPEKWGNEDIWLTDHADSKERIVLQAATPLTKEATRRNGRPSEGGAPAAPSRGVTGFQELAQANPLLAVAEYRRIEGDSQIDAAVKSQAAETLRVSLEDHGQQILIRYLHGEQLAPQKPEFELGAQYFEEATRLPRATTFDESRMWFCRGRSRIFDRDWTQAEEMLRRSVALDPEHAYAYNALGIAYLEQVPENSQMYGRAMAEFEQAHRYAPDWAYPLHNMALAYEQQGRLAEAENSYREAMRRAPHYSYLPYNLGLLYQRMHRLEDARRMYQLALKTANDSRSNGWTPAVTPWKEHANILNALGSVAAERNNRREAEDDFEAALEDVLDFAAAKYNLAMLLSRNGPSARAVKLWQENIAADPKESASRLALAAYLAKQGDRASAIREYEGAVAAAKDSFAARRELALLYGLAGRWQEAYEQLKAAHDLSPKNAAIAESLGDAGAKIGKKDEALEAYRAAENLVSSRRSQLQLRQKISEVERR